MNLPREYGYIEPEIQDEDYVLGAFTKLPKIELQKDGIWYPYLPKYEPQFNERYDSYGCTVWGTENAIETFLNRLTKKEYNFSERFTYILAGITPPGADPHHIAEIIREFGLIEDKHLPFTKTYGEFLKPKPMVANLLEKGQEFLKNFSFGHEYVFKNETDGLKRLSLMKEALRYSPLGVSVTAWHENAKGEFESQGKRNNHWCVCFRIDEFDRPWIFDSYDQTIKILSKDHFIKTAKRYHLAPYTRETKTTLISYAFELIADILKLLRPQDAIPPVVPESLKLIKATMEPLETPREALLRVAKEHLGKDVTPRDHVPDVVACAESLCNVIQSLDLTFPILPYTPDLLKELKRNPHYVGTLDLEPGNIIINATATGNGRIPGHCGVILENGKIASNNSKNGLWEDYYTIESWKARYRIYGGMPTMVFKKVA